MNSSDIFFKFSIINHLTLQSHTWDGGEFGLFIFSGYDLFLQNCQRLMKERKHNKAEKRLSVDVCSDCGVCVQMCVKR